MSSSSTVSFGDVQVSLSLFAEGLAGEPVTFAMVEEAQACWPWVPAVSSGEVPVPVELPSRQEYRAVVLQQLLTAPAPEAQTHGPLFSHLYDMLEDIRAAAVTRDRFPGAVPVLEACQARVRRAGPVDDLAAVSQLVRWRSLGGSQADVSGPLGDHVWHLTDALLRPQAGPGDSARIARKLLELSAAIDLDLGVDEWPPGIEAPADESEGSDGIGHALDGGTPSEVEDRPGSAGGQLLSELGEVPLADPADDAPDAPDPERAGLELPFRPGLASSDVRTFVYDEWDHNEQRLRLAWCRVIEERLVGDDVTFLADVRRRHQALRTEIRNSLMKLPPRERVRVHRSFDGDELDLDAALEAMADRRSGAPADDRLRIRRDRGARDVATAFLVDLSASTSSPANPPEPEPPGEFDPMADPLDDSSYGPIWGAPPIVEPTRRVIDVAKDAVALMGDALDELGDRFAIYGFSGTGRDNVEFKVSKDFDDAASPTTWAAVEAMKPLRYTRMGPAVRHATAKLAAQPARTRMLLVISDGYPQDVDYGRDRHDRDYGMYDTARALADATALGIQTFCLTIDPAGHDYLGEMCPDERYVVLDDIESLPAELARLYFLELRT